MKRLWGLVLLFAALSADAGTLNIVGNTAWVRVRHVIDGDTFITEHNERVRLLGINAPEIAHDRTPAEPLGYQAKAVLRRWIQGKTVHLIFDTVRRDAYGRWLAHVELRDGRWINGMLVRQGLAFVYTFEPNHRRTKRLLQLEAEARKERLGIWRTARFRVLEAERVLRSHVGQFRLVVGTVKNAHRWRCRLGRLAISVPRRARQWFSEPFFPPEGSRILVRGKIRAARNGTLYLAIYSPWDWQLLR